MWKSALESLKYKHATHLKAKFLEMASAAAAAIRAGACTPMYMGIQNIAKIISRLPKDSCRMDDFDFLG